MANIHQGNQMANIKIKGDLAGIFMNYGLLEQIKTTIIYLNAHIKSHLEN